MPHLCFIGHSSLTLALVAGAAANAYAFGAPRPA
jgi:hypothetical protein